MRRLLVQMHHSGYNGFGILILLDKLQRFLEKLFDFGSFLPLEELRRSGNESFHHSNAIRACTASCFCNLLFGFSPVFSFGLDKMEIQVCTGRVNVGVTCVFLLGALVVGFNAADLRSLVLRKSQNSVLCHYLSLLFCHTMS